MAVVLVSGVVAGLPASGWASTSAYAWGAGDSGQLGDGSGTDQLSPRAVSGTPKLVQVSASEDFTVAVAVDGTAWAWGANGSGQLGNGSSTASAVPVAVTMPSGVTFKAVAANAGGCCRGHVIAVDTTGMLWGWGADDFNDNGTGSATNVPARITAAPSGVSYVAVGAGADSGYAVASDGTPYAWGDNGEGELNFPSGVKLTSISGGCDVGRGLDATGQGYAFGSDYGGQLGTGGSGPGKVVMPPGVSLQSISPSHCGPSFTVAVSTSGQVYAWGANGSGQLGDGTTTGHGTPQPVTAPAGVSFVAASAGNMHALALDSTGRVWAWGDNKRGQLGNGSTNGQLTPQPVSQPMGAAFDGISAGDFESVAIGAGGGTPPTGADIGGSIHARVVEGVVGQPTINPWVATFADSRADGSPYAATVGWGDGTTSSAEVTAAGNPHNCDYLGQTLPGPCFIVSVAAGHPYASDARSPYLLKVTVTKNGHSKTDLGIGEIVAPHSGSADQSAVLRSTGQIVFNHEQGTGCTATALAHLSVVVTAHHCTDFGRWQSARFYLDHGSGDYWCGEPRSAHYFPEPGLTDGPLFIPVWPCATTQGLPDAAQPGVPIEFNPPRRDRWLINGSPVRVNAPDGLQAPGVLPYHLYACGPVQDTSGNGNNTSDRDGILHGPLVSGSSCSFPEPTDHHAGTSGSPWVNTSVFPNIYGLGAVFLGGDCLNPGGCSNGDGASVGYHEYAGEYLGDTAMQEYIQAVLADRALFPVVSAASVTHQVFAVGARGTARVSRAGYGTVFGFGLDRHAVATITITLRVRSHYRPVGKLVRRHGHPGDNRVPFTGRIGRRSLKPGRYLAVITARDRAGHISLVPADVSFRVIRR